METKTNFVEYIGGAFLVMVAFISIVNVTAGLIGGIWLLFEGLFSEVLVGFLYGMFGHYILGFVMMITLVFGVPGAHLFEKGKYIFGSIFLFLNQLVSIAIVYFSVMYIFGVAVQLSEYANFIPVLLFAYATSFAPWAFLANEDKKAGNQNAAIMIISGQIGFIFGILFMFITGQGAWVSVLFLVGLLGGTVLNIIPVIEEMRMKKETYQHEQQ
jgi:MFS family permease